MFPPLLISLFGLTAAAVLAEQSPWHPLEFSSHQEHYQQHQHEPQPPQLFSRDQQQSVTQMGKWQDSPLDASHTKACTFSVKKIKLESTTGEQLHMLEFQAYSSDVNIAPEGTASQSSTLNNNLKYAASMAIDGSNTTFSHTNDNKAYWELELDGHHSVQRVVIVNRYCGSDPADLNGCLCHLSNASLTLLDMTNEVISTRTLGNTCGKHVLVKNVTLSPACSSMSQPRSPNETPSTSLSASPLKSPSKWPTVSRSKSLTHSPSNPPSTSPTATCSSSVRKVRLESTSGGQIQMFEFSAYSSGVNVALQGSAVQSSVLRNDDQFAASKAIDGNSRTFCHTQDSEAHWEVDLNGRYDIESVVISNRWCGSPSDVNGCLCRLSNANLLLLDETDSVVAARSLGNTCGMLMVSQAFTSNPSCVTLPPSKSPSKSPTAEPTRTPSDSPSDPPSVRPSASPSGDPSASPTLIPTKSPSNKPTSAPSTSPSASPSQSPNYSFTLEPSASRSGSPTARMSNSPTEHFIHSLSLSSERKVNLSVNLGECSEPVSGVVFGLGSVLSLCIKTPDTDVVISGLKDVYLADADGNDILLIVDGYGRTSFTSSLDGIGSSLVDLSTLMSSTIFDQGYGGTLIDVRGTVLVTYVVDSNSRTLRHFQRSGVSLFSVEFVVGGAAKQRPQIVDAIMHSSSAANHQHSTIAAFFLFTVSALMLRL